MTMSEPLLSGGWESSDLESMSSVEGSPASPSADLDSSLASPMSGGDGLGWQTSFAQYDPSTSSWRTSQLSFDTLMPSDASSVTFTDSGSMRSGQLSPRAPWVPHIDVAGCTSWRTPVARDFKGYTKREGISICNQLREIYGGTGRANPTWLAWLMGFPGDWCETQSTPTETP
jgi:hypothetical protein